MNGAEDTKINKGLFILFEYILPSNLLFKLISNRLC